ncbi:hypothetical protein LCGC14_3096230 [marine sediment metagenome]|uniref:Uncharacterized protein n=1 Tax=marine sediment metagenome TaxID=412755 RepID=A0A0F8YGJ4_9ZZZZ
MKPWKVTVSNKIEPEIQKKFKRLLRPVLSVAGRPEKCRFCETMTTWTINNQHVCPACHVKYEFLKSWRIPDKCEVCAGQGEWCTDNGGHSLCYLHRNAWHRWKIPELDFIDHAKQKEEWLQAWEEGWAKFISFTKERYEKYAGGLKR